MRLQPTPAFVAKLLDAIPADGSPISPRGIFVAIGGISTPAYVRTVLRQLERTGAIMGAGQPYERVYRRAPAAEVT
jgi:hypothetical protein